MASRPGFYCKNNTVRSYSYDFEWFPGLSKSQKQKSVASLHSAIQKLTPEAVPLEISTKGLVEIGNKMSAFNLKLNGHYLESTYHSAKVFSDGGPYTDILNMTPKDAKHDPRLRQSGDLTGFLYNGFLWKLDTRTAFYDYIYLQAVKECLSTEDLKEFSSYTHFTDIEYNPRKSFSTQARSAAILKLLLDMYGEIPADMSEQDFIRFHRSFVMC